VADGSEISEASENDPRIRERVKKTFQLLMKLDEFLNEKLPVEGSFS